MLFFKVHPRVSCFYQPVEEARYHYTRRGQTIIASPYKEITRENLLSFLQVCMEVWLKRDDMQEFVAEVTDEVMSRIESPPSIDLVPISVPIVRTLSSLRGSSEYQTTPESEVLVQMSRDAE